MQNTHKRLLCWFFLAGLTASPVLAQSYLPFFDTVAQAHQHCPDDQIAWIKSPTAALQNTKMQQKNISQSGYVCRIEAVNAGYGGLITHLQPLGKH